MSLHCFTSYVGIDYSGAATSTSRSPALQVYRAELGQEPQQVESPASSAGARRRNWNRQEVFQWLAELVGQNDPVIVGIDHGFSVPCSYFEKYQLSSWDEFLEDFVSVWKTDLPQSTVEQFRDGATRCGSATELRLTEKWTSSAKSVFQFDVQGSVAKSTHAGLPFLKRIRNAHPKLHFWPFDGFDIPKGESCFAETFPSLFRNRYAREHRSPDEQDAFSICKWLQEMDRFFGLDRYLHPPLSPSQTKKVQLEGWILGVT